VDPVLLYSGLVEAGYEELPIIGRHTLFAATLPQIHKDPFDRILLAQAAYEGISILTADRVLADYPCSVLLS
jgi:PIN domain nuclease of toxin-antitoxin system